MSKGVPITGDLTDFELALICEKFHVLPSQVMAESAYWVRRVFTLLAERDRAQAQKSKTGKGKKR